jgi:hypothetical protein
MELSPQRKQELDAILQQRKARTAVQSPPVLSDERKKQLDQIIAQRQKPIVQPEQKPQGFLASVGESAKKRAGQVKEAFGRKQTMPETALQTLGAGAGFLGDVLGAGLISTVKAITPDVIERAAADKAKEIFQSPGGQAALQSIQGGMESYQSWKKQNPRAAANIESVVNIASLLPTQKIATTVAKPVVKAAEKQAVKMAESAVPKMVKNLNEVLTNAPKSVKTGVTKASNRGIDIGQELVNRKIMPKIENDRMIFTPEQIASVNEEIASKSRLVDNIIEQYSSTQVPVDEIKRILARDIANDPIIARQAGVEKTTNDALKIVDAYQRQTGRSAFSLKELQEFKKGSWEQTKKFNNKVTGESDAYSFLGSAFRQIIENEIPDANLRAINQEIGTAKELWKILDKASSLQGGGIVLKGGKIGKYASDISSSVIGASLGSMFGGPLGGVTGAFVGKELSNVLRGLSQKSSILGPLDRAFIKYAKTVPESQAIKETKAFLEAIKAGGKPTVTPRVKKAFEDAIKAEVKLLPAPKEGSPMSSVSSGPQINVPPKGFQSIEKRPGVVGSTPLPPEAPPKPFLGLPGAGETYQKTNQ